MTRVLLFAGIGLLLLMNGIFVSSLMVTNWIIIGTIMAVLGGGLLGVSAYLMGDDRR